MSYRTQLAYLSGGIVLVLGLLALLNPLLAVRLLGFEVAFPRGLSAMRATYGALFSVMGGFMLWAVPRRPGAALWLRIPGLLWLASAAGRLASIVIDGVYQPLNLGSLALELLVGISAVWGSYELPSRPTMQRRTAPPSTPKGRGERGEGRG